MAGIVAADAAGKRALRVTKLNRFSGRARKLALPLFVSNGVAAGERFMHLAPFWNGHDVSQSIFARDAIAVGISGTIRLLTIKVSLQSQQQDSCIS
jgi:hypothetical protein